MLDQKLKQAYNKIAPSSELEHRILSMQTEPVQKTQSRILPLKPIMSMAACAALLLGSIWMTSYWQQSQQPDVLLLNGDKIGKHAVAIVPESVEYAPMPLSRAVTAEPSAQQGIAIEMYISPEVISLSVDAGVMYTVSDENGEEIAVNVGAYLTEMPQGDRIQIRWILPKSEEDAEYRMTVGQETAILVTYCAETDEYLISCANVET